MSCQSTGVSGSHIAGQQPRRTLIRDHMKRPYADRLLNHRFVADPGGGGLVGSDGLDGLKECFLGK